MDIGIQEYGKFFQHNLYEITLINDYGMHVSLLNYGATLEKVELPTDDGLENVIMSLEKPIDYSRERNFLGGTVGRVAGRIAKGQWLHGGKVNDFPLNDGENSLHGGTSIDAKVWSFQTNIEANKASVEFTIFDPDGANGYPGNMLIKSIYSLDNDNNLHCTIKAVSDKTTLFNPTNHTYFRLDGPHSKIDDLELKLNSDFYIPVDDSTMPADEMQPVDGTIFDFRESKRLGKVIHADNHQISVRNGLDHPFVLNGKTPAAVLTSVKTGRKMVMTTDAQSLVIFTANTFNHVGACKNLGEHDGITLEAQFAPQVGNTLDPFVLIAGKEFSRNMNWKFSY